MNAQLKQLAAIYGDQRFEYSVVRKADKPKKRKLDIHVYPNGLIQVDAPENASVEEIKTGVQKRARWIVAQINDITARKAEVLPREYTSGETIFYLGRRYQLKIDKRMKGDVIKLYRGKLIIPGKDKTTEDIKANLDAWYREKAKQIFEKRLVNVSKQLPWVKDIPKWKLINMKCQWGSCSPKGVLSINPSLVKAPTICIDYVLLHELCHLKEHNHSKKFYALLDKYMLNWRDNKNKLDGMAELMLNA